MVLESLLALRSSLSHDDQIRCLGWALLLLWTLSITYMTRDYWFPSAFGLPPLSERLTKTIDSPDIKRKHRNSTEECRLEEEKVRLCASFVEEVRAKYGVERRRGDSLPNTIR